MVLSSFVLSVCFAVAAQATIPELIVKTSTGTVTGIIAGNAPNVRQFRSIPFAQPPLGDLRWAPPQPLNVSKDYSVDSTTFPPSCPQYLSAVPSVYNQDITPWIPARIGYQAINAAAGQSLDTASEDCLYLAVWTPTNATSGSKLPVLFFITGGAFETNGVNVPAQLPYHWVQRTQSHVVVTINYRLNIFGFPNAAGLTTLQNVGLLDQRAALEWARTNIEAFGGDASRITVWGQSAGAISVDYQNFAYPSDPIVSSFFAQSGSVYLDLTSKDYSHSNFSFMATNLGCGNLAPAAELSCMRKVDYNAIENFLGHYTDNRTLIAADASLPALSFAPIADNVTVFSNYTDRYLQKAYANKPMIYSTCAMEGESLAPYPSNPATMAPNQSIVDTITYGGFLCPAALSAELRNMTDPSTPTYRYLYSGNFSNVSPRWWMGAYHAADLAFLFGTHQDLVGPDGQGSTPEEFAVSEAMQNHVLEFAATRGYPTNWPRTTTGHVVDFGNGTSVMMDIGAAQLDAICAQYL